MNPLVSIIDSLPHYPVSTGIQRGSISRKCWLTDR